MQKEKLPPIRKTLQKAKTSTQVLVMQWKGEAVGSENTEKRTEMLLIRQVLDTIEERGPRADVLGLAIIILSSLPGTLSPPPALCV